MTADTRSKFRRDLDRWLEIVAQVNVATARLDDLIETCSNTGFPQRNVLVNLNELKMIRDLLVEPSSGKVEEDSSEGHDPEPAADATNVVDFELKLDCDSMRCLACGGTWFNLVSAGDRPPAVCADSQGFITGYHGTFECRDCGQVIA